MREVRGSLGEGVEGRFGGGSGVGGVSVLGGVGRLGGRWDVGWGEVRGSKGGLCRVVVGVY